ncbi:MAG TPA: hypothetical protein VL096_01445, partial [Pirellulaceae bacterium]|nr:hypothetical protein [Pirellulaceae bacterium]
VVLGENVIYSGHQRNLLIEGSRNIVVGPHSFDHNPDYGEQELSTGLRIVDSQDIQISGCSMQDALSGENTVKGAIRSDKLALLEIVRSKRVNVTGCQLLNGTPQAVLVDSCSDVALTGCMLLEPRAPRLTQTQIRWQGQGSGNLISACRIGAAKAATLTIDKAADVTLVGNRIDES